MSWSSRKKNECIFCNVYFAQRKFVNICVLSQVQEYSVLNKLSEYIYFYISENITSYTLLLVFKIFKSLQCILKESKYSTIVIQKHCNKKLVIIKNNYEYFKNSTKCQICDNDYVDGHVKVRDHCHITGNMEVLHIEILISRLN